MIRLTPMLAFVAAAMATLFPTTRFAAHPAAGACFSVLLLCAVLMLAAQPSRHAASLGRFVREHWALCLAFLAVPLSIAFHGLYAGEPVDVPYSRLRFGLFFLVCWLLLQVPGAWLRAVRWGWAIGVCISAVWLHRLLQVEDRPGHIGTDNLIPFTDLSLLMGVLAFFSIGWVCSRVNMALAVLAGCLGLYVALASGTRGSWLAIPVFIGAALFLPRHWPKRWIFGSLAVCLAAIVAVGTLNTSVAQRVNGAVTEWRQFDRGEAKESSTAYRLQLWHVSWLAFKEHPVAGIGLDGFTGRLQQEVKAGHVPESILTFDHSHNEALWALSTGGVVGFAGWLALTFVPAGFFARRLRRDDLQLRTSAAMGFSTCVGFAVFGLTEVLSIVMLTNIFYTLTVALLVADVLRREAELAPRTHA